MSYYELGRRACFEQPGLPFPHSSTPYVRLLKIRSLQLIGRYRVQTAPVFATPLSVDCWPLAASNRRHHRRRVVSPSSSSAAATATVFVSVRRGAARMRPSADVNSVMRLALIEFHRLTAEKLAANGRQRARRRVQKD
jgi:hypothetical protein